MGLSPFARLRMLMQPQQQTAQPPAANFAPLQPQGLVAQMQRLGQQAPQPPMWQPQQTAQQQFIPQNFFGQPAQSQGGLGAPPVQQAKGFMQSPAQQQTQPTTGLGGRSRIGGIGRLLRRR